MDQKKTWNDIAKEWNDYRSQIPPTVEKFLSGKRGKILDLGCGSGRNFKKLKNLKWYGLDFSEEMIKYAKEKAKEIDMPVNLQVFESDNLSFQENFFDSILCYSVLHCIKSKQERISTIKEIYRTLKEGGVALISVWGPKSARLKNKGKECFIPWSIEQKTKLDRYTYVYEKSELENEAKKVGFKILNSWEERNINLIVEK